MAIRTKIANTQDNYRVFGLVAGRAGVGKTTCLTHFPLDQTLGISVENGFLSIAGSGVNYLEIDCYDDLILILTKELAKPAYRNVKYLYIDSLSEIYALLRRELGQKYSAKQNFAKFDEMQDKIFYAIRLARTLLHLNVFFTCHTKDEKNGMIMEEELAFDGKMPEDLKKQFDLIVHMKDIAFEGNQEKVKCFITNPIISKVAKRRVSPWLGVVIDDYEHPNLYQLTLKLMGKTAQ